jgi:high-affinity Fe2+/Pb2+ permease
MAERVRDFLRAHKTDGVGEGLGLAKLEELLQRAQVLASQQRVGVAMTRQATKHRHEVRRALQSKILRYLRAVGRVAAKQNGELANEFPLPPSNTTFQALITAGQATLEKATAQKDALVSLGMSPQVVDDLAKALGEFERTLEATREGRREHVGASADLEAVAAEVAEQVQLLDGVVQYRFGDDAELMGAWASARNVLGPFKPKAQTPGEGGSQTPKAA